MAGRPRQGRRASLDQTSRFHLGGTDTGAKSPGSQEGSELMQEPQAQQTSQHLAKKRSYFKHKSPSACQFSIPLLLLLLQISHGINERAVQ